MITANDFFSSRPFTGITPELKIVPVSSAVFDDPSVQTDDFFEFEDVYLGPANPDRYLILAFASDGNDNESSGSPTGVSVTSSTGDFPLTDCFEISSIGRFVHASLWVCPLPVGDLGTLRFDLDDVRHNNASVQVLYGTGFRSITSTDQGSGVTTSLDALPGERNCLSGGAIIANVTARVVREGGSHTIHKVGIKTFRQDAWFYPVSAVRDATEGTLKIEGVSECPELTYKEDSFTTLERMTVNYAAMR